MPMTGTTASRARRAAAAGALCVLLAACGTAARTAAGPPAAPPPPSANTCGLDLTTDRADGGSADPPTEEQTGSAGPPTEEQTGSPGPPTDEETGPPDPPTDQDTGSPGPPTDGGPCVAAGWYDMTREFNAYFAGHRTGADAMMPTAPAQEVRVRRAGAGGEAQVTFRTKSVGKGEAEDGRRVAQVFGAWRHEVYGDTGTLVVRSTEGREVATTPW
ncbi:hypothetical protein AB0953_26470 [Streptomyces sp. NPDC046866]|uniref:hypothetical protein n=1 Tax=Streptomyces sp. NPDC046866 TaxID=3154921 RepID=UPI003456E2F5